MDRGDGTLVLTFISRGGASTTGQGVELLCHTPLKYRAAGHPADHRFLSLGIEAHTTSFTESTLEASALSISKNLSLSTQHHLRFIRQGKRLLWKDGVFVQAFLWRMSASYERGFDRIYSVEEARKAGVALPDPSLQLVKDVQTFRILETKLGPQMHLWEGLHHFDKVSSIPEEYISTAYYSVLLPPILDRALNEIAMTPHLDHEDLAQLYLDITFDIVFTKIARNTFRFSPPSPPNPDSKAQGLPSYVLKYRLYSYLFDVIAFHFRTSHPLHDTAISAVILRTLAPLNTLITDSTITLENFERDSLKSISTEVARSRMVCSDLDKIAVRELLYRGGKDKTKRELLHIVTMGSNHKVYRVLKELIDYLVTSDTHPYSSLNPAANVLSKEQIAESLDRPLELKITVAETRPSCEGVSMARSLHEVVEITKNRATKLRELSSSSFSDPKHTKLTPTRAPGTVKLPNGLRERLLDGLGSQKAVRAAASVEPSGVPLGTNVSIEIIPDSATVSILFAAEAKTGVTILLAAEEVKSSGDVVARTGSYILAWAGTDIQAKVLVLAPTELVEASTRESFQGTTRRIKASKEIRSTFEARMGEEGEVVGAWQVIGSSSAELGIENFVEKTLDPSVETIRVLAPATEVVPARFFTKWLAETGPMTASSCAALSRRRGEEEERFFGKE